MVAAKAAKIGQSAGQAAAATLPSSGVQAAVPLEQWPDKLLFRIGELADLLGIETHVVRFWLKEFPTVRTERSDTGRLLFGRPAAERMLRIRELLYDHGYTLAGARKALGTGKTASKSSENSATSPERLAAQAAAAPAKISGPTKQELELQRQVETLQADLRATQARLAASQAGELAARARAQEWLAQQDAALEDQAQQNGAEREQWSDLAAALGDLAAEIRG